MLWRTWFPRGFVVTQFPRSSIKESARPIRVTSWTSNWTNNMLQNVVRSSIPPINYSVHKTINDRTFNCGMVFDAVPIHWYTDFVGSFTEEQKFTFVHNRTYDNVRITNSSHDRVRGRTRVFFTVWFSERLFPRYKIWSWITWNTYHVMP